MNPEERDPVRLGSTALQGAAVMLFAKYFGTVTSLVATAVVARFVTPAEVGVVTAAISVMALVRFLEQFGLAEAVVQRLEIRPEQISALFWINTATGFSLGLAFVVGSPVVARFFGQPELAPILAVLSLTFVFDALGGMPRALLRRSFRFRALAATNAISTASGSMAGIAIAVAGGGSWAIVGQAVVNSLVYLVGSWIASGWRPGPPRRGAGVGSLLRFGIHVTMANGLGNAVRNIDNILIAKFVGPAALGAYDRAFQLMQLPMTHFNQPFNAAVVPALSRLQHEPEAYRRLYLRLNGVVVSVAFPIAVFSAVAAPAIVGTLLGPAWSESAVLLRWLSPAGLLLALNVAIGWTYTSLGRTGRQLRWTVVASTVTIVGIVAGLPWGAVGVAIGLSGSRLLLRIPSLLYCYHGTFLRLGDLWPVTWPPALAASLAGAVAFAVDPSESVMPLRLAVQAMSFAIAYLTLFRILPGGRGRFLAIGSEWGRWRGKRAPGTAGHA
jgi:O-antigen/teichoic acid export membrane protein